MRVYQENGRDLRFLSVLARCLPQSMSPLTRFHCTNLLCVTIHDCDLLNANSVDHMFRGPNLDQMDQNKAQNQVFCHFFKFGCLVFLEIVQDDSLEHCLTTSRGKTQEKKLGGTKLGPKLGVFPFSQGSIISFP